jgi:hypothetical protein
MLIWFILFNSSVHTSSFSFFFSLDDGQNRVIQFGSSMDRWLFHVPSAECGVFIYTWILFVCFGFMCLLMHSTNYVLSSIVTVTAPVNKSGNVTRTPSLSGEVVPDPEGEDNW